MPYTLAVLLDMLSDAGKGELLMALAKTEEAKANATPWPRKRVERLIDSLRGNILEPWKIKDMREFGMRRHAVTFAADGLEIDVFSYADSDTYCAFFVRREEAVLYVLVNPDVEHSHEWEEMELQRKLPA